jgi:hypothetical protein
MGEQRTASKARMPSTGVSGRAKQPERDFYSLTTLIALGPFGPCSSSNDTLLPSARER